MIELKNNPAGNFFLLAGPCVIEGEEMAMRIAERVVGVTEKLQIPYVFKGSYRKANRSRLDSFTGIGDEKALKVLKKVHDTFGVPTVTDIHSADEAEISGHTGCHPFIAATQPDQRSDRWYAPTDRNRSQSRHRRRSRRYLYRNTRKPRRSQERRSKHVEAGPSGRTINEISQNTGSYQITLFSARL